MSTVRSDQNIYMNSNVHLHVLSLIMNANNSLSLSLSPRVFISWLHNIYNSRVSVTVLQPVSFIISYVSVFTR